MAVVLRPGNLEMRRFAEVARDGNVWLLQFMGFDFGYSRISFVVISFSVGETLKHSIFQDLIALGSSVVLRGRRLV